MNTILSERFPQTDKVKTLNARSPIFEIYDVATPFFISLNIYDMKHCSVDLSLLTLRVWVRLAKQHLLFRQLGISQLNAH